MTDADANEPAIGGETVVAYLGWGALVTFAILGVVAGAGLYGSLGAIIDVWVAPQYQPIASAGVNLAVLCVAGVGIVLALRRLQPFANAQDED